LARKCSGTLQIPKELHLILFADYIDFLAYRKLVKLNLKYEAKIKELKSKVATLEKQLGKKKAKAEDDSPKRYRGKSKPKEKVEKLIASKSVL
jgi:hypothetical protein